MNEPITCKSCGNTFKGQYCNHCGEKVITEKDRKLRYFLGDFINSLTFADSKFWRTLKIILIHPGSLSHHFIEGRRKPFMKPISIFLFANLIYFLFPLINTFTTNLELQTNAKFIHSGLAKEMVEREIERRSISYGEYEKIYNEKTSDLSRLLIIAMAMLLALFFLPIHWGSPKNLFADHLTVSLEIMAFILLYNLQLVSVLLLVIVAITTSKLNFLFSNNYITTISLIILTYIFYNVEINFYGFRKMRSILNVILCLVSITFALYLYRALLFFVTFWSV